MSQISVDSVIPQSGTSVTLGASGDTITLPSGATLNVASGATISNSGTASGFGKIVQFSETINTTIGSTTSRIPADTTIPQNTEGYELLTVSITPTSATNKLLITASATIAGSQVARASACLFQDSTADALTVADIVVSGSNQGGTVPLNYVMTSGTTSSTTFKIRVGTDAGTCYFGMNGNTNPLYGGVLSHSITVMEIAV